MFKISSKQKIALMITILVLVVACFASVIVDCAIHRSLSWSWIVLGGCVFALLAVFPALCIRPRPLLFSLLGISAGVIPYLALIAWSLGDMGWFPLARTIAVISVVYAWFCYFVFAHARWPIHVSSGVTVMGAGFLGFAINWLVNPADVFWNAVNLAILLVIGIGLLIVPKVARR